MKEGVHGGEVLWTEHLPDSLFYDVVYDEEGVHWRGGGEVLWKFCGQWSMMWTEHLPGSLFIILAFSAAGLALASGLFSSNKLSFRFFKKPKRRPS